MAVNATCVGLRRKNRPFLCMLDRFYIFTGIVIFSLDMYIFYSPIRELIVGVSVTCWKDG